MYAHQSVHLFTNAIITMVIKRNYCQPVYYCVGKVVLFQSFEILLKVRDRSGKNDLDMTSHNTSLLIGYFLLNPCIQKEQRFPDGK